MKDINNEAAKIKHVFLLLENRRESSFCVMGGQKRTLGTFSYFQNP